MNPKSSLPLLILSFILFSCNRSANADLKDTRLANIELAEPDQKQEQEKAPPQKNGQPSQATPLQANAHTDWDKQIIKTGTLTLEVKSFSHFNESLHATVRKMGAYIAQEEQHANADRSETSVTIKVPVDQFETMMNELAAGGSKLVERVISSEDVTGEVIDTKSRLEAKKQTREKYLDFLKASKNMEEVLKVQHEINTLQEEMEAAAGRIEYLSHQSSFSTIHLSFYEPIVGVKPVDPSPGFLTRLSEAFQSGAQWMANFFVSLVAIWPVLFIIFGGVFIIKRTKIFKSHPQNQ